MIQGWEKLDGSHSFGVKGLNEHFEQVLSSYQAITMTNHRKGENLKVAIRHQSKK